MAEREAPSGRIRLVELVDYQPGSVVSRSVAKAGGSSITVFAFDAGEGLDPHSAPFEALIEIIDGRARVELSGETYALETGDCLLMPANAPHAVQAVERFKMTLTLLRAKE